MKRSETQGLERGLKVLECLVRQGAASVREVAARTRLPAATVRRLLNTLDAAGFVTQARSHQPYRATMRLKEIATALSPAIVLREAARLAIADIARGYPWPLAFIQWTGTAFEVMETTPRPAKLEPTRYIAGWRLRPPYGAAADVLFAFATADVRAQMDVEIRDALRTIRADGYCVRQRKNRREQSIAVPVIVGRVCVGALETRTVMEKAESQRRIVARLRTCAENIIAALH
jgi:DNA-binding IclR family transcriptional regulator